MSDPFVPPPAGPSANPYAAPATVVADIPGGSTSTAGFIPAGRVVDAGRSITWYSGGWELFKKQPLMFIVLLVLWFVIAIVASFIPLIGPLALALVTPVFMAGMLLGCDAINRGEELEVGHLFAGFKTEAGNLMIIGAIMLGLQIAVMIVMAVVGMVFGVGLGAMLGGGSHSGIGAAGAFGGVIVILLLIVVLYVPINAALYFAPALVVFNKVAPVEAMKTSLMAVFRNIVPFIVFAVVTMVAGVVAAIPIGLGWFVLGPVLMAILYVSYRDVFYDA
ncbi:hypothetical protein BH09PSE6_BH09PSE6_05350 [soil metagenome]